MRLRDLLSPRLALRFYLVGLAQMVVIALGFWAILELNRPPLRGPIEQKAIQAAMAVQPALADRSALDAHLRAYDAGGATLTVIDPSGAVLASTSEGAPRCTLRPDGPPPGKGGPGGPPPLVRFQRRLDGPPGPPPPGEGPHGPPLHCAIVPLSFDSGDGQLHYLGPPPERPPPLHLHVVPLVLLVVGVTSILLARSLLKPLAQLSSTARAFGSGTLSARTGLDRSDELGEVSKAFDEMADRVTQLLRAERELIANVSHELRTPLARIRVALDIAAEGDAASVKESLADIAADLAELERLIEDVLTAARLELTQGAPSSGIPPLRKARIAAETLVDRAAARFRSAHPDRPLEIEAAGDLPEIEGDAVLVRRAIDNLLENAHKYTEAESAPVRLIATNADDTVSFEVVDQGIGISKEDLENVFRPFFRADKSRTRATGGLGLGLALAKRIAEAHGGTLELTSEPGEGTRATLRLPVNAK